MKHKFIVNDENIVNEYGYRVMTDGIDTVQFMRNPVVLFIHSRGFEKPTGPEGHEVIGRVVELSKKDGQLIAEVEFDVEDDYAKKIAGKVDRGYIRMASIFADVKETSTDLADVLPEQIFETVTKSKLVEVSIVDIGGNDNALKLSREGKRIKLKRLDTKSKPEINTDMDMKTIALSLGMSAESKPETIQAKVAEIKLAKEQAEARVKELEKGMKDSQTAEATTLVDKAVKLGLIPEGLKESQIKSFENDFEGQKVVLTKLISDKEEEDKKDGKQKVVREVMLGGGKTKGNIELTFDYLQKNDPNELRRIRDEEPAEYARLAKDYAAGKRFKA